MKNPLICILFICAATWSMNTVADADCEKKSTLVVTLPDDVKEAPEVDPERLCVEENGKFDIELANGEGAKIIFTNKTPLVKNNGTAKYSEKVTKKNKKKQVKVKKKCNEPCKPYKYRVIDTVNTKRPELDPVIIIER